MKNKIIDSHCHLDFPNFKDDLNDIIKRAKSVGVSRFLAISINFEKFNKVLKIAKNYPGIVWCTTGLHPNNVSKKLTDIGFEEIYKNLEKNIINNKKEVIGIGESGLDFFRSNDNRKNQLGSFSIHLEVSGKTQRPIVIHSRAAEEDTICMIKKKVKYFKTKGLLHCFASSKKLAKVALDNDFFISFSGLVTFSNSYELKKIVQYVPLEKILVETDSPYLSPEPYRGKRNEPKNVIYVINKIAELKNLSTEDIAAKTTNNFFNLFSNING